MEKESQLIKDIIESEDAFRANFNPLSDLYHKGD